MRRRHRLGEILVSAGLIDGFQLRAALADQQRWGGRLGASLVKLGFLEEDQLVRALAGQLGLPIARLAGRRIAPEVVDILPGSLAEKYGCIPLFTKREGGVEVVYLGMEDPTDLGALDDLTFRIGMKLRPVLVAPSELREAIRTLYGAAGEGGSGSGSESASGPLESLLDPSDTQPLVSEVEKAAPLTPPREAPSRSDDASWQERLVVDTREEPASTKILSTRTILHALTRLLIDKGVVDRQELLERARALAERGRDSSGR